VSATAGVSAFRVKPSEIEPLRSCPNVSARLTLQSGDQPDHVEADATTDSEVGLASGQEP
jgi:hypothetical protein